MHTPLMSTEALTSGRALIMVPRRIFSRSRFTASLRNDCPHDQYTPPGMLTQGGQGGHAAPLASRLHRISTHFLLNLHGI